MEPAGIQGGRSGQCNTQTQSCVERRSTRKTIIGGAHRSRALRRLPSRRPAGRGDRRSDRMRGEFGQFSASGRHLPHGLCVAQHLVEQPEPPHEHPVILDHHHGRCSYPRQRRPQRQCPPGARRRRTLSASQVGARRWSTLQPALGGWWPGLHPCHSGSCSSSRWCPASQPARLSTSAASQPRNSR